MIERAWKACFVVKYAGNIINLIHFGKQRGTAPEGVQLFGLIAPRGYNAGTSQQVVIDKYM